MSASGVPLVVIAGPTGSGKSDLALAVARRLEGEILNFDSVQMVRGFDVGSAKPSEEARKSIPHHLFDVVDPTEHLDAARFVDLARPVIRGVEERGRVPILVGGTFFYLRALLEGLPDMPGRNEEIRGRLATIRNRNSGLRWLRWWLGRVDPVSAERISPADSHRIERALEVWISTGRPISSYSPDRPGLSSEMRTVQMALRLDRDELRRRLDARVARMFENGLVSETRRLLERWPSNARAFDAIGYREALELIRGETTELEAIERIRSRTWAYARRQLTWLRGEREMQWVDAGADAESLADDLVEMVAAAR